MFFLTFQTEKRHIDTKILFLVLIIADIVTGIITEIQYTLNNPENYVRVSKWIGFFLPLAVYILASVVALVVNLILICHGENGKDCWPSLREWVDLFTKLVAITGGILYFVGNNLETIVDGDTNFTSVIITVLAIALYRLFPLGLEWLQEYCKKTPRKLGYFNLWSPNSDTETNSLLVVYTILLKFVIDFNIFFRAVLGSLDTSQRLCNRTDQVGVLWFFYGGGIGTFCTVQVIIVIIFYYATFSKNGREDDSFTIKLSNVYRKNCGCGCCCVAWDIVLSLMVAAAVAFYLVADNRQFLECYLSRLEGSQVRIILLSLALIVFLVVFIGFWFRKECLCVQVKGKFEKVTVDTKDTNETDIEMSYSAFTCTRKSCIRNPEKHTVKRTIPPRVPPAQPVLPAMTYDPNDSCNDNLYKGDMKIILPYVQGPLTIHACTCTNNTCTCSRTYNTEHVTNCLQGIDRAVSIRKLNDQIVMVHTIESTVTVPPPAGSTAATTTQTIIDVYLVVHSTSGPAIDVYKVDARPAGQTLQDLPQQYEEEENVEKPLLAYKYKTVDYEIYMYRHNQREETKYAVRITV